MKKHYLLRLAFIALLSSMIPMTTRAQLFAKIDNLYYMFYDWAPEETWVVSPRFEDWDTKYSGDVTIVSDFRCSYEDWDGTTTILNCHVIGIETNAFGGCSDLTSVTIPNSVKYIESGCFSGCNSLTSITLPTELTTIESSTFRNCTSLISVTIPNKVKNIKTQAFEYCSSLTSITIPNSVISIGRWAFHGCSSLTKIILGNSVNNIEDYAFSDCSALTSIIIPNSMTTIETGVFQNCSNLTKVTIGKNINDIDAWAFGGCYNIKDIFCLAEVPPTVTSSVFEDIYDKTTLYVPSASYQQYKDDPVWGKFLVKTLDDLPIQFDDARVKAICVYYWDTNRDGELSFKEAAAVTTIGEVFKYDTYIRSFDELQYFTGLTYIVSAAFEGCINLFNITIPQNVYNVGYGSPFQYCYSLAFINVDKDNAYYDSRNNCNAIIEKATYKLVAGCTNTKIPEDVVSIDDYAFAGCKHSSFPMNIPAGVTSIGMGAFEDCEGLSSIYLPEGITSIGNSAFSGCCNLTSIVIPSSVKSIGARAFHFCTGLKSIEVDYWNTDYDSRNDCNAIIETATNKLVAGCMNTTIPEGVVTIGDYAFDGMGYRLDKHESLTSINIPESVRSIGDWAFASCDKLKRIYCHAKIPPTVTDFTFNFGVNGVNPSSITLIVPNESYQMYKDHPVWGEFYITTATSINFLKEEAESDIVKSKYYDLNGQQIPSLQKGVNIIHMSDGTTRKVMVK